MRALGSRRCGRACTHRNVCPLTHMRLVQAHDDVEMYRTTPRAQPRKHLRAAPSEPLQVVAARVLDALLFGRKRVAYELHRRRALSE